MLSIHSLVAYRRPMTSKFTLRSNSQFRGRVTLVMKERAACFNPQASPVLGYLRWPPSDSIAQSLSGKWNMFGLVFLQPCQAFLAPAHVLTVLVVETALHQRSVCTNPNCKRFVIKCRNVCFDIEAILARCACNCLPWQTFFLKVRLQSVGLATSISRCRTV